MHNTLPSHQGQVVGSGQSKPTVPPTSQQPPQFQGQDDQISQPKPVGGMAKEQLESAPMAGANENVSIIERREPEHVPEEVEGWLEKLERDEDVNLQAPIQSQGQVVVSPAGQVVDEEQIVLPLTEEGVQKGVQMKVVDSARWLAEWCVRVMKKFHSSVVYKSGGKDMIRGKHI